MDIREKAAYVKGLLDGLELDQNEKQTKLLNAVVALLQDMSEYVGNLEQSYDDVCDQIDALNESVAEIADVLDEEDDWDDEDDFDEETEYEFTCPTCGKTVCIDENAFNLGGMSCPNCGEELEFDFSDDDEEVQPED